MLPGFRCPGYCGVVRYQPRPLNQAAAFTAVALDVREDLARSRAAQQVWCSRPHAAITTAALVPSPSHSAPGAPPGATAVQRQPVRVALGALSSPPPPAAWRAALRGRAGRTLLVSKRFVGRGFGPVSAL